MRVATYMALCLAITTLAVGAGNVSVPWDEFKDLYRQRIEKEIREEYPPVQPESQVHSIEEARYTLNVTGRYARGTVLLSGGIISGPPTPIPLFGDNLVITTMDHVTGGTILSLKDEMGSFFLPDKEASAFEVAVSFLAHSGAEDDARILTLDVPRALRNSLDLTLPSKSRLLRAPGITGSDGLRHFAATPSLSIRYLREYEQGLSAATVIEIDALSRISVQQQRVFISTSFLPMRALPQSLALRAPKGAKYLSSSLRASRVKQLDGDRYELRCATNQKTPFTVEFVLEAQQDDGAITFLLPTIEGNSGQQGRFIVEEPDDGQVTVTGNELVSQIPANKLGAALSRIVGKNTFFMNIPVKEPISLILTRFQTVASPPTVLDAQRFFSSFEENGNVLSVLMLDVPPEIGSRLKLEAVPDSEIWSLTVNGAKRQVFAGDQNTWLIPLDSGKTSHVELAILQSGSKLGLQGRLETRLPRTHLASRQVDVGIALPARVELMSVEGLVSPASGEGWKLPTDFLGKQYFFSRAFYSGEGMKLAISYKEPVNQKGVSR